MCLCTFEIKQQIFQESQAASSGGWISMCQENPNSQGLEACTAGDLTNTGNRVSITTVTGHRVISPVGRIRHPITGMMTSDNRWLCSRGFAHIVSTVDCRVFELVSKSCCQCSTCEQMRRSWTRVQVIVRSWRSVFFYSIFRSVSESFGGSSDYFSYGVSFSIRFATQQQRCNLNAHTATWF